MKPLCAKMKMSNLPTIEQQGHLYVSIYPRILSCQVADAGIQEKESLEGNIFISSRHNQGTPGCLFSPNPSPVPTCLSRHFIHSFFIPVIIIIHQLSSSSSSSLKTFLSHSPIQHSGGEAVETKVSPFRGGTMEENDDGEN